VGMVAQTLLEGTTVVGGIPLPPPPRLQRVCYVRHLPAGRCCCANDEID